MTHLLRNFALGTALAASLGAAAALKPLPVDTAVRIGTLPNGLTYYIRNNNTPKGLTDFFIAQRVGSVQETDRQQGLAHFLEHMCFNGTTHFQGNTLINYLESVGVKFGANLNAYTSTDETVYNICDVPSQRYGTVDSCVMILSDWSHGLLLDPEEIDKERGVITGEWRQRNGAPQTRLLERAAPLIYPGSKYGQRMPIGKMDIVENFEHKALRDFYDRWYWPVNQAVVVVGDINPDSVETSIRRHFGNIQAPAADVTVPAEDVPDNKEVISVALTDPEQAQPMVMVMIKHNPLSADELVTIEDLRHGFENAVLREMLNERLVAVRDSADSPFTSVMVRDNSFMLSRVKDALTVRAFPKEGKLQESVAAITRELKRAAAQGFTESELQRAKLAVWSVVEDQFVNRNKTSNTDYAREYVRHFLDGGTLVDAEKKYQMLKGVRHTTDLNRVNSYLASIVRSDNSNVVVLAYLPEKFDMAGASEASLRMAYENVDGANLPAFTDHVVDGPLLASEPLPGAIVKEEDMPVFGAKLWTLSNGIKMVVKHNVDDSTDRINIKAWSPGGFAANYDASKTPSYKVTNDVIAQGGFGNYSSSELRRLLVGRNVSTAVAIENMAEEMAASATPADLGTAFRLLYLKATSPRRDSVAYTAYIDSQRMRLANSARNAAHAMGDSIHAYVFNHHPLIEKIQLAELPQVSYNDILDTYRNRFANMSDFTFSVVGNFDEDSLRTYVEHYVASLPGGGRKDEPADIGYRYPAGQNSHHFTFPMEVEQAMTYSFYHSPCEFTLENVLHARILGDIISDRLLQEVREKRGWTYGVLSHGGINGGINAGDPSSFLMPVNIRVSKGHEQETTEIVRQTVADMAGAPVSDEELQKVKQYMLKGFRDSINKNAYWQSMIHNYMEHGADMHSVYEKTLSEVTPESLRRFAASHLNGANRLELIMTPAE